MYGLSNNMLNGVNNINNEYSNFLGVLKPKLYKNMYFLESNNNDNKSIILDGLNNTSQIGIKIKKLGTKDYTYLNNDMLFWFKFNNGDINGTALYNHASKQYIGTLNNGSTISTTQPRLGSGSLNNTATNAYYDIGTNIDFTAYSSGLTLSFFYKSSITNTTQTLFVFDGVPIADTSSTHIQITNNNQITYRYFGLNLLVLQTFTYNLCDGKYHHFLLVFGNISTHYLYIDGILQYTLNNTNNDTTTTTNYIGENSWSTGTGKQAVGYFDDFRLYNRPLTSTEITDLYNSFVDLDAGLIWWYKFQKEDFNLVNGSLYEYVSKTFITNALANGATYSSINPKIGNACLDLSNNIEAKVNAGSINFTNTTNLFTFTCWFRPNTDKTAYNILTDYRRGSYTLFGNFNLFNFQLDYDPVETIYKILFNNGSSSLNVSTPQYGDTINNSWLHLVAVFGNLQTFKIYINGELIGTNTASSSITGNFAVTIGQSGYGSNGQNRFNAWMNDYRVYNRELTANEVVALYELGNIDYEIKLSLEKID